MSKFLLTGAVALLASCSTAPPIAPATPDPIKAMARSLAIIRDATPQHPRVLKILFYGQSISTPKWTDQAMATLRAKYPDVAFDYRNLALGGWSAKYLARAVTRDVADFYPDLIIFHVYGDHHAYEQIIQTIRSQTAADVVVQTDHVVEPIEPLCPTGFHLRWSAPLGCTGHFWFKQHRWGDFMSGLWIPTLAHKYDLAMEPRRQEWNSYLQSHHLDPMVLIHDNPHPNAQGWTLMANLFTAWFEAQEDRARQAELRDPNRIVSLPPPWPGVASSFHFDGNRLEMLAAGPLDGKVLVRIDGKAPEDLDGCWQNSRVSRLANVTDWPALKQVTVDPALHRADRWTIRITHFDDDAQDKFSFALADAGQGPKGSGTADTPFTSPDGRVKIDPQDWNTAYGRQKSGKGLPDGTSFTMERSFVCVDQPEVRMANGAIEQRHVLATGLANRRHLVELLIKPGAPAISELRTYNPPLHLPS